MKPSLRKIDTLTQGFNGATLFRAWNAHRALYLRRGARSFNGATLFRAWNAALAVSFVHCSMLQWSHTLSSVECLLSPALISGSGGGFNGATLFRAWNGLDSDSGEVVHEGASMEPHSFERGMFWSFASIRSSNPRFNGATLFRAWNVPPDVVASASFGGFNGATLFRAWNG